MSLFLIAWGREENKWSQISKVKLNKKKKKLKKNESPVLHIDMNKSLFAWMDSHIQINLNTKKHLKLTNTSAKFAD